MLSRQELERLEAWDASPARVLSLHQNLDPTRQVRRSQRAAFEDLVREAKARLDAPARAELEREAKEIEAWLEGS